MKFIWIMMLFVAFPAYAEESTEAVEGTVEETPPPTYMECFKHVYKNDVEAAQQDIQEEMEHLNSGGTLPIEPERERVDIRSLNPKVNPGADDVKASLQIDLPPKKQKKEEAKDSPFSQCKELYGLE